MDCLTKVFMEQRRRKPVHLPNPNEEEPSKEIMNQAAK
ncbi:hypothetical protein ERO13_D11G007766v2 [Gossypium hirsutum]|nr:hypothetical protein ERO13_D11G007766v2 [Gossypium hirsutum]